MTHPIIFLHLPKTGGTSYGHLLRQHCSSSRAVDRWHQFDPRSALGEELLLGHLLYDQIRHVVDEVFLATLLRHPIERTISYYEHARRAPDHADHELACSLTLEQFAERGAGSQQYLTQLTGHADPARPGQVAFAGNVRERVELATQRLASFDHIAITEHLAASVALLAAQLSWSVVPEVPQLNVGDHHHTRHTLRPATIDAILHRAWPDVAIYDAAVELHEQQRSLEA